MPKFCSPSLVVEVGFILLAAVPSLAQTSGDLTRRFNETERRFHEAERQIVRLSPNAFPELPGDVARELLRRGCTIPQDSFTKSPHNVIRGAFAKAGQTDWAVLCSVKGVSTILVFWNGSPKGPAEVGKQDDRTFLQSTAVANGLTLLADNRLAFSRKLSLTPVNDHLGIEDASFLIRTSLWYFYKGGWLKLPD